jgi:hypothetical protein
MAVQDLADVGRKAIAVVVEIEPPSVPLRVIGRHVAGWVYAAPPHPQRECELAGTNWPTLALVSGGQREELAPEEVEPQIPRDEDARKPS